MKWLTITIAISLAGCATALDSGLAESKGFGPAASGNDLAGAINHYLSSVMYERAGQYEKAVAELRKAADLAPNSVNLQVKLLGAYYMNQDYENAVIMAERATKEEPENTVLHVWLGRIYYQLERYDDAIATFEKAVAIEPDSALAYEALAEVEEKTNDLVGAVGVYERLLKLTPDSPYLYYRLGLSLAGIDDNKGAVRAFEKALELNPELMPAVYLLGALYLDAGNNAGAIRLFRKYMESRPKHVMTRVNLAGALARSEQFDEAIDILSSVIEEGRADPLHHVERIYLYLRRGNIADASLAIAPNEAPILGTFLQALTRKTAGEPYSRLMKDLDSIEGDLDFESSEYLNGILSLFGDDASDFLEKRLREMLAEEGRSRVVETLLARLLMSTDRDEEAVPVLLGILETHGSEKWLHYYLATVFENLNQSRKTEKHLKACLEYDPNDPDVMNFLGYMYAEENIHLEEAEKLVERALQLDPDNGFYLDSLGWVYYRMGDGIRAVQHIKRAIRAMSTDDSILRDHLGDAYLLLGEVDKAMREWKRAKRLDPDLEGVQEKIDKYQKHVGE